LYGDLDKVKLLCAALEIHVGMIKLKIKGLGLKVSHFETYETQKDGTAIVNTEGLDDAYEKSTKDLPEQHKKYLSQLERQIERASNLEQKRLDNFEKAALLSKEVTDSKLNRGVDYLEAKLTLLKALRLKRKKMGKLKDI
jgi:hypothetical protein